MTKKSSIMHQIACTFFKNFVGGHPRTPLVLGQRMLAHSSAPIDTFTAYILHVIY